MEGISVIIPALNEEHAIGAVIEEIKSNLTKACKEFEIIVVNDGSTDRTGQVAQEKGSKLLKHPISAGYGASINDGLKQAKYNGVVIVDADGTYPIAKIPELISYLGEFDMVVGARTGKNYRGSLLKHPLRKFFKLLCEFVTGVQIPDANSGLRAFKKDVVMKFEDNFCPGFSFTTTITLALHLNGYFVKYLPIEYYKRKGRSNIKMFRDTLRATQIITQAILYYNPIKLFLLLTIVTFSLSMLLLVLSILMQSLSALLFSVSLFTVSFLFFGMGLLADAIVRSKRCFNK